nr:hypothetical protein [Clostridia bacterium]
MCDVAGVASKADVIVNGYAFTKKEGNIQVLNLNRPDKAALFSPSGEMLETSMDDIELDIARNYLERNKRFMED